MKTLKLTLIYSASFIIGYLILSVCGLVWAQSIDLDSYKSIVFDVEWFFVYKILIGWWLAILPTRMYYMKNYFYYKEL